MIAVPPQTGGWYGAAEGRTESATAIVLTAAGPGSPDRQSPSRPVRHIDAYYSAVAPIWDLLVRLGSVGAFPRLHRRAADALELRAGQTVLDIGCGTGLLLPFLAERVGPDGRVVAVDASARMLSAARRRVERHGWNNVELRHSQADAFEPVPPVHGVVFSISLSAFPECESTFERAIAFLEPGGRMVVVDAFLNYGRPIYRVANLYTRLKAPVVGSALNNRIRETANVRLDRPRIDIAHGGLYTIISGRAPA